MSFLILNTEVHYHGRVSQKATTAMAKIKAKFNALGLSQGAATCPFRQFFLTPKLKFSRQITYQLLLRKVTSSKNTKM